MLDGFISFSFDSINLVEIIEKKDEIVGWLVGHCLGIISFFYMMEFCLLFIFPSNKLMTKIDVSLSSQNYNGDAGFCSVLINLQISRKIFVVFVHL